MIPSDNLPVPADQYTVPGDVTADPPTATAEATASDSATAIPTASPTATPKPKASAKPKVAVGAGGKSGGTPKIDASLASNAGSPLLLQLLAVAVLLGLGFLYFRLLRGNGRRGPPVPGK
ncbi:hypothetical protein [Paenarthrobacter sp. PH39-S1]|uniref:hypothetical protein n=1 Tax=Paenarthrobacter sp. PH39-S1 TaxID=3046204 RepID=UPI0024BAE61B|nr:hypothetical protein [Paenarthrobacter sp. PH39-S1]MDJ0356558.1 hypothetical protein [Paenarthrobacter sp. PH39-S1]